MKSKFEISCTMFILTITVFVISSCGGTKLFDIDKTSENLRLSETQRDVVEVKTKEIKKIAEDYETEKEKLKSDFKGARNRVWSGGSGGRRRSGDGIRSPLQQKIIAFYQKRPERQKQIDALIGEIKEILNEDQLDAFTDIKLPVLEMPNLDKGSGMRGGGRRRGGGGFGGF